MTESIIRECTYGIMQIRQSRNIAFRDCRMLRNREFTLISVDACDNVVYEECLFEGNMGPSLFRVTEDNDAVRVDRCRFVNNDVTKFARTMGTFSAVACEFMKNTFTDHRETSGSAPRPTPRIEACLRGKYPHAFTETDRVSATDLGKRCMRYCTNRSIAWSRYFLKHVPNDEGYGASFTPTPDGFSAVIAPQPVGLRLACRCVSLAALRTPPSPALVHGGNRRARGLACDSFHVLATCSAQPPNAAIASSMLSAGQHENRSIDTAVAASPAVCGSA